MARDTTKTPVQHRPGILHSHHNCLTVRSHDRCASFHRIARFAFVVMIIAYTCGIVKRGLQISAALLYGKCTNSTCRFLSHLHNRSDTIAKAHRKNLCSLTKHNAAAAPCHAAKPCIFLRDLTVRERRLRNTAVPQSLI